MWFQLGHRHARHSQFPLPDCPRALAFVAAGESSPQPVGTRVPLLYGDPVPGYRSPMRTQRVPPDGGPVEQASRRICFGHNNLVAIAYPHAESTGTVGWQDFPPDFPADATGLSPAVAALALRVWGRLHGLVALESHGHLRSVFNDPATLFEAELLDVVG
ncbi:TetR-like C-terminal domain-containing protein [Kibdelosporangium aridum]|uniref:HTH-type transcriptional regulator MT1864/Rv1816-like C-terminal domain-containing protein n=1 Tax=Kibdelosporangium aridum TaxID=2030 RepID=A0A1Y5YBW5_KIBAR|nr:TetR-like C-terminal domain-containing protein [Kibdelosporangium aridum]SMD27149.1 hypothetical protein SAMN05661093_10746 [Kibdelosporangium aridum]